MKEGRQLKKEEEKKISQKKDDLLLVKQNRFVWKVLRMKRPANDVGGGKTTPSE